MPESHLNLYVHYVKHVQQGRQAKVAGSAHGCLLLMQLVMSLQRLMCCVPQEVGNHPFWQTRLPALDIPPEPALEEFIRKYRLAVDTRDTVSNKVGQN